MRTLYQKVALYFLVALVALGAVGCGGGFFPTTGGFEGRAIVPYGMRSTEGAEPKGIVITPGDKDAPIPEGFMPLVDAAVICGSKYTETDTQGLFRITGLSPGVHSYTINDPDYEPYTDSVTIEAGEVKWVGQVPTVHTEKEWLIMVYMAADNNLGDFAYDDLEEMERVGSSSNVDIVVQADFAGYEGIDGRYYIEQAPPTFQYTGSNLFSLPVETMAEPDSGDYRTLLEFVQWATERYPATRRALVIWDHGDGWFVRQPSKAIAQDTDTGSIINIDELAYALSYTDYIDVLAFDACLMNTIEVACEIANTGNSGYLVASQENVPAYGLDYDSWLQTLDQNPAVTPVQLATSAADNYFYNAPAYTTLPRTMTVLNLANVSNLVYDVNELANAIYTNSTIRSQVKSLWDNSLYMYPTDNPGYDTYEAYVDLKDFASTVSSVPGLSQLAASVESSLATTIGYHVTSDARYKGMSISSKLGFGYSWLDFGADTTWDELVALLNQ